MAAAAVGIAGPVAHVEPDVAVSGDLFTGNLSVGDLPAGDGPVSDPGYVDGNQGYGQHLLGLAGAWSITKGSGDVIIAVVDSGVSPVHPEFAGRLVAGYDFINKDDDPADDHGHGTHVAGIAAAGINGVGTVGVCPECKIMPVKVLNERNGGTWSSVSKGILFAVDNGADVINLSLGATVSSTTLISSVQYALDHDVVVVAAAGNLANNAPFFPAAAPGVVGVSGTDAEDRYWPVSNYGDFIDVAAPGVNIYSSYYSLANGSGYAYMSGTSMASPFVTGLAALIRSRRPDLSAVEVAGLLSSTAKDLGDPAWDRYYGAGRVDAHAALVAANDGMDPATPAEPPLPAVPDPARAYAVYLPNISRK
jgi:subtilisin family serine protease